MADDQTKPIQQPTPEQKQEAVRRYYDALGRKDKAACAALFKEIPFLRDIFSEANHS